MKEATARFLSSVGLAPVILHEQASRSQTIIEKLAANADVEFAVILLSPDDVGRSRTESDLNPRARQNVIFEWGYFYAALGRENVCALHRGVELPSDVSGVLWIGYDQAGAWKQDLRRELEATGFDLS